MPQATPFVVGLTGGIGSGKSTVASLFEQRGAALIDTDAIAHALTAAGGSAMPALIATFGTQAASVGGALDRTWMRERAFSDPASRARLEAILHPMIRTEAEARLAQLSAPYVLLAVPLLSAASTWHQRMDRVLVVDCSSDRQMARVVQRSGLTREQVLAIIAAQVTREQRLGLADDVIDNDGAQSALPPQIDALHQKYLRLAQSHRTAWPPGKPGD